MKALFNIAMLVCGILACYSAYRWNDYLIATIFVLAVIVFLVTKWYVTATEMPEDFDDNQLI